MNTIDWLIDIVIEMDMYLVSCINTSCRVEYREEQQRLKDEGKKLKEQQREEELIEKERLLESLREKVCDVNVKVFVWIPLQAVIC